MTIHTPETEIREMSAEEIDAAAGALHIHIKGLFHLEITEMTSASACSAMASA